MTDPQLIQNRLDTAEDAFEFATGTPTFEPGLNAGIDAESGEVQIQKACRLLDVSGRMDALGEFYGAVLEQSFIAIEQTFSGYLLAVTGTDEHDLRDHRSPYELAIGQVPLENGTIRAIHAMFEQRRNEHYYGTLVTTREQADAMRALATAIHHHVVEFDPALERFCRCSRNERD